MPETFFAVAFMAHWHVGSSIPAAAQHLAPGAGFFGALPAFAAPAGEGGEVLEGEVEAFGLGLGGGARDGGGVGQARLRGRGGRQAGRALGAVCRGDGAGASPGARVASAPASSSASASSTKRARWARA